MPRLIAVKGQLRVQRSRCISRQQVSRGAEYSAYTLSRLFWDSYIILCKPAPTKARYLVVAAMREALVFHHSRVCSVIRKLTGKRT